MKDKLMGRSSAATTNPTRTRPVTPTAAKGLLKTGDGGSFDLAQMGGLKKSVTKKACSSVLDHAKSFL